MHFVNEYARVGNSGSFDNLFSMIIWACKKFSLWLFFSGSKPNTPVLILICMVIAIIDNLSLARLTSCCGYSPRQVVTSGIRMHMIIVSCHGLNIHQTKKQYNINVVYILTSGFRRGQVLSSWHLLHTPSRTAMWHYHTVARSGDRFGGSMRRQWGLHATPIYRPLYIPPIFFIVEH